MVFFDLGRVVLDWVPERPFARVMDPELVPGFMERVDFYEWNRQADNGRPYPEIEADWCARFPADAEAILAYRRFNDDSIPNLVPGVWALVAELQQHYIKVGALSNWSADTFTDIRRRFRVLDRFDALIVSGFEGVAKPDPAIFALACERLAVQPAHAVFIDDIQANVDAAIACGLHAVLFTGAAQLRADLAALGLPVPVVTQTEPIFHLTERRLWEQAQRDHDYPWSTQGVPFEHAGFVHFSFADQVSEVRVAHFAGTADDELVLLRLDPQVKLPLLIEDGFPHLYAPLPVEGVVVTSA